MHPLVVVLDHPAGQRLVQSGQRQGGWAGRSTTGQRAPVAAAEMAFAGPSIQGANSSSSVVDRLGCLRGVSTLTAFGLAVEIGDWQRLSASHRTDRSGLPSDGRGGRFTLPT